MGAGKYGDDSTGFASHFFRGNVELERRSGFERRRFHYDAHIPERRGQVDRRNGTNGTVQESFDNVAAAR
jgi:hypothetical protein